MKARLVLLERYQGAVYRYLLGALRDTDSADELFQDFAVRFLRGAFHRADPGRGRFRDFVKTALVNLVIDYRKREGKRRQQRLSSADVEFTGPGLQTQFNNDWREELVARAWDALARVEQTTRRPFWTVLKMRSKKPRLSSSELAAAVTARMQLERPLTEVAARKLLQRAREKFADLLVAQVAGSLSGGTLDDVEEELIELGLIAFCRRALDRRRVR